jgi:hypothetical protein
MSIMAGMAGSLAILGFNPLWHVLGASMYRHDAYSQSTLNNRSCGTSRPTLPFREQTRWRKSVR